MNTQFSLGDFDLFLQKSSNNPFQNEGCIKWPPIFDKFFPPFFDLYKQGIEIGKKGPAAHFPHSLKELGSRIQKEMIPKLQKAQNTEEANTIIKELYYAFPEMKELVSEFTDKFISGGYDEDDNGQSNYAIPPIPPIPPVVVVVAAAVAVYAIGYAITYFW